MAKPEYFKRVVKKDNLRVTYEIISICQECGAEFRSGCPKRALWCKECGEKVRKEQARLRAQSFRERKRIKEEGWDFFDK